MDFERRAQRPQQKRARFDSVEGILVLSCSPPRCAAGPLLAQAPGHSGFPCLPEYEAVYTQSSLVEPYFWCFLLSASVIWSDLVPAEKDDCPSPPYPSAVISTS